jgi:hypothetical protein
MDCISEKLRGRGVLPYVGTYVAREVPSNVACGPHYTWKLETSDLYLRKPYYLYVEPILSHLKLPISISTYKYKYLI